MGGWLTALLNLLGMGGGPAVVPDVRPGVRVCVPGADRSRVTLPGADTSRVTIRGADTSRYTFPRADLEC